jgi:hypothetical protein
MVDIELSCWSVSSSADYPRYIRQPDLPCALYVFGPYVHIMSTSARFTALEVTILQRKTRCCDIFLPRSRKKAC